MKKPGQASGMKASGHWPPPTKALAGKGGAGNQKEPAIQILKGSSKAWGGKGK